MYCPTFDLSASLFIRHRRLLEARCLLTTTDMRVSEVCDAVGINNHRSFTTYFTKEFQVSPSEFRKLTSAAGSGVLTPPASSTENLSFYTRPFFKRAWL